MYTFIGHSGIYKGSDFHDGMALVGQCCGVEAHAMEDIVRMRLFRIAGHGLYLYNGGLSH
jgi:hypothetical protein